MYLLPLKHWPRPFIVAFSTFGWLLAMKAPSAAPPMVAISKGSAFSTTAMLPPCAMNTPNTADSATIQPMMTNMWEGASWRLLRLRPARTVRRPKV